MLIYFCFSGLRHILKNFKLLALCQCCRLFSQRLKGDVVWGCKAGKLRASTLRGSLQAPSSSSGQVSVMPPENGFTLIKNTFFKKMSF